MKSKIDITEFRNRLKDNTKIGSPKLKFPLGFFSVFTDNSKCFYGRFDNSTFEIDFLIEDEEKGGRPASPWFDNFMYELGSANALCGNALVKVILKINGLYRNYAYRSMSHDDIKRQIMDSKAILDHLSGRK